jgi:hypothetical protein
VITSVFECSEEVEGLIESEHHVVRRLEFGHAPIVRMAYDTHLWPQPAPIIQ